MDFTRKLMEADPMSLKGPLTRTVDSLDVFKKLKQRDQKKMAGINRQMQATDKAMEKARNTNDFMRKAIK